MAGSRIVHPNLQVTDITSSFRDAINGQYTAPGNGQTLMLVGLSSGQLVKDDDFTLFEAVGALEVNSDG